MITREAKPQTYSHSVRVTFSKPGVIRYRFSAFWLRSKCSICSYQLNESWSPIDTWVLSCVLSRVQIYLDQDPKGGIDTGDLRLLDTKGTLLFFGFLSLQLYVIQGLTLFGSGSWYGSTLVT